MSELEEKIDQEIEMYVRYCQAASRHDAFEQFHRIMAHTIFYHIQEMRQTGKVSSLGDVIQTPIS